MLRYMPLSTRNQKPYHKFILQNKKLKNLRNNKFIRKKVGEC